MSLNSVERSVACEFWPSACKILLEQINYAGKRVFANLAKCLQVLAPSVRLGITAEGEICFALSPDIG